MLFRSKRKSTRPRRVAPARRACGVARLARRRGYALRLAPCIRILAERNAAHAEYSDRLLACPDERVLDPGRDLLEHVGIGALPAGKYRQAPVAGYGKYDAVVALLVEPLGFRYGFMRENHHGDGSHFRLDHQVRNVVCAK